MTVMLSDENPDPPSTEADELLDQIAARLPCMSSRCYPASSYGRHSKGCVDGRNTAAQALLPLIREREARLAAEARNAAKQSALAGAREGRARDAAESKLERVEALHERQPADSPFNHEGRDVCGTCMDGHEPADWPCPTIAALADTDRGVA